MKSFSSLWIAPLFFGIESFSRLPFSVLHPLSTGFSFLLHRVFRYRVRVVRQNLEIAFPNCTDEERKVIEKKFYQNFSDLLFETLKTFTVTEAEVLDRCRLMTPEVVQDLFERRLHLVGISSHLANWEWLALSMGLQMDHICFGVYKPLSNQPLNQRMLNSRQKFGLTMVAIRSLRRIFEVGLTEPVCVGLLADQAPHDYKKAIFVNFFGRPVPTVAGPAVISVQKGFIPVWGWMRRVGRSRFEWGIEELPSMTELLDREPELSQLEKDQLDRICQVHHMKPNQAVYAMRLTQEFSNRLEKEILRDPPGWLWSHRRWKARA